LGAPPPQGSRYGKWWSFSLLFSGRHGLTSPYPTGELLRPVGNFPVSNLFPGRLDRPFPTLLPPPPSSHQWGGGSLRKVVVLLFPIRPRRRCARRRRRSTPSGGPLPRTSQGSNTLWTTRWAQGGHHEHFRYEFDLYIFFDFRIMCFISWPCFPLLTHITFVWISATEWGGQISQQ